MGMRSMNVLVVAPMHKPTAEALKFLAGGELPAREGGVGWVWETNISPLWARHSVEDLKEEVAILSWLLSIPASDYLLVRAGEELGTLGTLKDHPFDGDAQFESVVKSYIEEMSELERKNAEAPVEVGGKTWYRGHPPHIGWYLANPTCTDLTWRYWTGITWSTAGLRGDTVEQANVTAKEPENDKAIAMLRWSDFWPEGLPLNRSCLPPK